MSMWVVVLTMRSTKIPGVTTLSGSSEPVGTISFTSAIVRCAPIAKPGAKFRMPRR